MVLKDEFGIIRQIGIVSTGAGCGFKMYPGVYTRVSSYHKWIDEQIKKTHPPPSLPPPPPQDQIHFETVQTNI